MNRVVFVVTLALWCFVTQAQVHNPPAEAQTVPNAQFNEGAAGKADSPADWTLSGGKGRWVDRQLLEVTGDGNDSNYWRCDAYPFAPATVYHFELRTRRTGGSGTVIAGPDFANHDYSEVSKEWAWYGHIFRTPEATDGAYLRLGQWRATGSIQFDAVRVKPAVPVFRKLGRLLLGEGELIRGGRYEFDGRFSHAGGNFHRVLREATAHFNSNRWSFGGNSRLIYCFEVPGCKFRSGRMSVDVNYHTRGGCLVEVSQNQTDWRPLATQDKLGEATAKLPADLLPAERLFIRLRCSQPGSSFQVDRVQFQAELEGNAPEGAGRTLFADIEGAQTSLAIERITLEGAETAGPTVLRLTARNLGEKVIEAKLLGSLSSVGQAARELDVRQARLDAGQSADFNISVPAERPGEYQIALRLEAAGAAPVTATLSITVPDYYRTDYGQLIAGGKTAVWWCNATHKIPLRRAAPTATASTVKGPAASLSAAKNDFEAVQIVVRPTEPLRGLTATAGPLSGPEGAVIPAGNVEVLRVYYHFVEHPTDRTGIRDYWPDALPPLAEPIDVQAGHNQPLWLLVHVPKDAKSGDYAGQLSIKAEGFSASVPIRLHVWDFTLPEEHNIATAFGLSPGNVFRYHRLKTEADKRKVLDKYFHMFADHRISTYDPTPLDPIRVKFLPKADPPRAEVDFSAFDPAMARAVNEFHIDGFRLPIQGMGGGTFHARHAPEIAGFTEEMPQYQAMFSSYIKQIESHLREKGWLEKAYVYWFDEPAPKDYAFVRGGMERLKRYAPGIATMLTEQVEEKLAGPVDIWCPVSPNFDVEAAKRRRAHGERFWWYVCCGPKAPYCTLFIDHPASELRVWLWQTWQREIVGVLVWQSTYWTSSAAYPDKPQNPYLDPMGYVSGYSTPKGVKRYWGNGDGRFIYPPLSAATPGIAGPGPVLDGPVSSIRWEMLREGIEDYECLHMLRELLNKRRGSLPADRVRAIEALLAVPPSITTNMTTFTTDPTPIYTRRKAIAEAIERLAK